MFPFRGTKTFSNQFQHSIFYPQYKTCFIVGGVVSNKSLYSTLSLFILCVTFNSYFILNPQTIE